MNTAFRPSAFPRPASSALATDDRPRVAYDLAWLNANGRPEWDTRMLPASLAVDAACSNVARGSLIGTPNGDVAVEDLIPGMEVTTLHGKATIQWIGARTLPERAADGDRPALFRVTAGAFAHDAPRHDVVLSASAAVLLQSEACRRLIGQERAFAPISAFEDGYNITRITPAGDITVFNLAFREQEAFSANGVSVESFHPGRNSGSLLRDDVLRDLARLFPHLNASNAFGPQRIVHLSMTEARGLELF